MRLHQTTSDANALDDPHTFRCIGYQRWSPRGRPWPRGRPRGHILKSLALALASKPQVLENCPVLGSRTVLFLNRWNFVGKRPKPCGKSAKTFFLVSSSRDRLKKFLKTFFAWKKTLKTFFFENTRICVLGPWPWPREGLSSALASKFFLCPWPWPRALCPRLHLCWLLRAWKNQHLLTNFQWTNVSCDFVEFLSTEFAAYLKPHSRDEIGCRLNQDYAIRVVVKETPLPFRSRCRLMSFSLWFEII